MDKECLIPATYKQIEYIQILSSYDSSKNRDEKIIDEFLDRKNKINKTIENLSVTEASELIQELLKVKVQYCCLCGKEVLLDKRDINRGRLLGEMELCGHHCSDFPCVYFEWDNPKKIKNSKKLLKRCVCCRKVSERTIRHHIDYQFNVVIPVCETCHRIIHSDSDDRYNYFKPLDKQLNDNFNSSRR